MSQLQNQLVCLTQSALSSQSNTKNITSRTSRTWREIYSRVLLRVSGMAHWISAIDYCERHLGEGDLPRKCQLELSVRFSAWHTSCFRVGPWAEAFGLHGRRRRAVVVDSAMGKFSAQKRESVLYYQVDNLTALRSSHCWLE